jgi:hypothetical protein
LDESNSNPLSPAPHPWSWLKLSKTLSCEAIP